MQSESHALSVFEHQALYTNHREQRLSDGQLASLQRFHSAGGSAYYSLLHNGVKFSEYVGALQVGGTVIEILPKAGKSSDVNMWRRVLISMLRASEILDLHAPTSSDQALIANSVLDLYFELFANQIEYLLRRGLIKKYRKAEGNVPFLKGTLMFSKHITKNLVHQERFYTRYSTYDVEHDVHAILYKALTTVHRVNRRAHLSGKLGALLLAFPQMYDFKITEDSFKRIPMNRKTMPYKAALDIARLILLNYHPDLRPGADHVLALMFDMNHLWERFVYLSLKRYGRSFSQVKAQQRKKFWKPESGYSSSMVPDIVIDRYGSRIVLDTKWKNLSGNPSPDDLRQMFVYLHYYQAKQAALVYPGASDSGTRGAYYSYDSSDIQSLGGRNCGIIKVAAPTNADKIVEWQKSISRHIEQWCESGNQ